MSKSAPAPLTSQATHWQAPTPTAPHSPQTPPLPTITSAHYDTTTVTLTMSEPVYATTAPTATDFKVSDDGTAITVSGATVAATKSRCICNDYTDGADHCCKLSSESMVHKGCNKASERWLQETSWHRLPRAVQLPPPMRQWLSTHQQITANLTSLSGNLTIDFSEAVYSNSTCTTALTNTTAGTITALKEDDNSGRCHHLHRHLQQAPHTRSP